MKIKAFVSSTKFVLKKYSPEILLGLGLTGMGIGTILACKATLKCEEILDEHAEKMAMVEEAIEIGEVGDVEYTMEIAKKDRFIIKSETVIEFVKLYGPSVTLMGASVGCILGAHHIMSKRNVALMAAYKVVEEAFTTYRGRVVKELGEAKDSHFMYGTETIDETETIVDENGKKKKVTNQKEELIPGVKMSGFARLFEEEKPDQTGSWYGSTQWSPIHEYNLSFLNAKEKDFNDKLIVKGFVVMNDVYEELGFPPTEAGMICGWRYKSERGDGYISFRPRGIDGNWAMGVDGDAIVLDFNIDGVIFDENIARGELN